MKVTTEKHDNILIVEINGRVDISTAKKFESALLTPIRQGVNEIVVDLGNLTYLSSAGLRTLLTASQKTHNAGGALVICEASAQVLEVLKVSGLSRLIASVDTRDLAIASFKKAS